MSALELPTNHKDTLSNKIEETILENLSEPMIYNIIDVVLESYAEIQPELEKNNDNNKLQEPQENKITQKSSIDLKNLKVHSDPDIILDRKSVFQAHVCEVKSKQEVDTVHNYLYSSSKKIAEATHNIIAYRITQDNGSVNHDFDDDGESGAGGRLAHLLEKMKVENVYVMVSQKRAIKLKKYFIEFWVYNC